MEPVTGGVIPRLGVGLGFFFGFGHGLKTGTFFRTVTVRVGAVVTRGTVTVRVRGVTVVGGAVTVVGGAVTVLVTVSVTVSTFFSVVVGGYFCSLLLAGPARAVIPTMTARIARRATGIATFTPPPLRLEEYEGKGDRECDAG
jgi:hypothetical protein